MTTLKQLNWALPRGWQPSARYAAMKAAAEIGAEYMYGNLVRTDECIAEVHINRKHTLCWATEAECPEL